MLEGLRKNKQRIHSKSFVAVHSVKIHEALIEMLNNNIFVLLMELYIFSRKQFIILKRVLIIVWNYDKNGQKMSKRKVREFLEGKGLRR